MITGRYQKRLMTELDHDFLSCLIKGMDHTEASKHLGVSYDTMSKRLERLKRALDVKTTYQLVALEVIFQLGDDCP